jgi:hypothetical protein
MGKKFFYFLLLFKQVLKKREKRVGGLVGQGRVGKL